MDLETILEAIAAITTVWYLWRRIQHWRSFVRKHPPSQYVHGNRAEAWRWATPPAGIELDRLDTADFSRLTLPYVRTSGQMVALVFGGALLLLGLYMMFDVLLAANRERLFDRLVIPALTLLFGGAMLDYDSRLIAIDLQRDRVVFVLRYSVYLTRNITMKIDRVRSFGGKVQSLSLIHI